MTAALTGLKILEIGQWVAAPYCTAVLADLGADVIKVERPGSGDDQRLSPPYAAGQSALFNQMNRNKRSLTLELDTAEGRAICLDLAAAADVVVSNFRPGTIEKLGLGYEAVSSRNPRVIYALITGFGIEGSLADRAGMDLIAQAMSGMMLLTANPEGRPGRVPMAAAGYFASGQNPPRYHLRKTANAAPYNVFQTGDGWVTVVAAAQPLWESLCRVIGREDLNHDPRFSSSGSRIQNVLALEAVLTPIFLADTSANWLARMDAARIPCSPVMELEEILNHPHLAARNTHVAPPDGPATVQRVVVAPIRMSDTPVSIHRSAPALGQDTAAILAQLESSKEWPAHARPQ